MSWPLFTARNAHLQQMAFVRCLIWLLLLYGEVAALYSPYDDATLTLTSTSTPDPFVSSFRGRYYLTFTAGDRIEIWSSSSLVDMEATAVKHRIWEPPPGTDHSDALWAPELHAVRGRWYIYYTAASAAKGNKSHRLYVLGGPAATADPCAGAWAFLGPVRNMPPDQWAIDGTVFELEGQLYLAYSGWPIDDETSVQHTQHQQKQQQQQKHHHHRSEFLRQGYPTQHVLSSPTGISGSSSGSGVGNGNNTGSHQAAGNSTAAVAAAAAARQTVLGGSTQNIYLARLRDPWTAEVGGGGGGGGSSARPVAVGVPRHGWEATPDGRHAINEGPQWLAAPDGRWRGLVFSCAGSWTPEYKMATLRYLGGGDPLDPRSWRKASSPLLQNTGGGGGGGPSSSSSSSSSDANANANANVDVGPFGPGHGSFLDVGGGHVVAVYHATDGPRDGWANRRARVRRVAFTELGPYMGPSFGVDGRQRRRRYAGGLMRWVKGLLPLARRDVAAGEDQDKDKDQDKDRDRDRVSGSEAGLRAFLEAARMEKEAEMEEM